MMCPQRETSFPSVPANAARTSGAGCCASEAVGKPPSLSSRMPTCSSERRAAGGMSVRGRRPNSASSSSVSSRSSSAREGNESVTLAVPPEGAPEAGESDPPPLPGRGCTTGVPCGRGVEPGAGEGAGRDVGAELGAGVGRGAGVGAGSSNPGGSRLSGASCAPAKLPVPKGTISASAAAPANKPRFIPGPPPNQSGVRLALQSDRAAARRHPTMPKPELRPV